MVLHSLHKIPYIQKFLRWPNISFFHYLFYIAKYLIMQKLCLVLSAIRNFLNHKKCNTQLHLHSIYMYMYIMSSYLIYTGYPSNILYTINYIQLLSVSTEYHNYVLCTRY